MVNNYGLIEGNQWLRELGGTIGQDCPNVLPVIAPLMTVPVEQFLVTLLVSRPNFQ